MKYLALILTLTACGAHGPIHQVCFSPRGGCQDTIISTVLESTKYIRVGAYVYTSVPITEALITAHNAGVDVKVVADFRQACSRWSQLDELVAAGVDVRVDRKHTIQHNKYMVVDGRWLITGSYNFTKSAEERNAENLLLIRMRKTSKLYKENWQLHYDHSEPFACESKE